MERAGSPTRRLVPAGLVLLLLAPAPLYSQAGDVPGEEQPPLADALSVPPAPARSAEEERATFALPEGFSIELVASEPLVGDPVAMAFDGDGRLWVCEMRAFMPDVDGRGEDAPLGAIAVLSDRDGDGRMDRRTVFLDGLVLPRAVAPCEDGALVIAPPELLFCRDTDGDLVADEREVVADGLEGLTNPEHAINGLVFARDNWFHCANASVGWRRVDGKWTRRATAGGGQWGISFDDRGRAYFDDNSDPLRAALFPSHYAVRNPNLGLASGANVRLVEDFAVFPARVTPGVNRGYRAGTLRADGTLATFTAACAPLVYRGDALPSELRGDVFVCEPSGNLVKRYRVEERGLALQARAAYPGREFLTSTDERFRPVWLANGPDGALYVADMYRGLIQHRVYVTSFLRKQVEARGLAEPIGLGRIWRVVHGKAPRPRRTRLSEASWTELVAALAHPSGWLRDTAQRLLVEEGRGSSDARELVREAALEHPSALGRVHALWALEGIRGLDEELLGKALGDGDPEVRLTAVRLAEPWLAAGSDALLARVVAQADPAQARLFHQVLLSLGEAKREPADAALLGLLLRDASTEELRTAALSGLCGRELAALERCLESSAWRESAPGCERVLELLALCVTREGRTDRLETLLELLERCEIPWQRRSIVAGTLAARTLSSAGHPGPIRLAREPRALSALEVRDDSRELARSLTWPGKPGAEAPVRVLTSEEEALFRRGRALYAGACASCHQDSGRGEPGKAPALAGSVWVLASEERLARILLQGLVGPLERNGESWNQEMPAWVASDEDQAALTTYLRREWGHEADPVTPATIARIRAATKTRARPWTAEELEALESSPAGGK